MKTIIIVISAIALTSCGVVDSVTVHGEYASYEIKIAKPVDKAK